MEKKKDDKQSAADVLTNALDAAEDFHTDQDNKPAKDQKWAKEVEGKK